MSGSGVFSKEVNFFALTDGVDDVVVWQAQRLLQRSVQLHERDHGAREGYAADDHARHDDVGTHGGHKVRVLKQQRVARVAAWHATETRKEHGTKGQLNTNEDQPE